MQYTTTYTSPIGKMNLTCDETGLTGLWFEGETGYAGGLDKKCRLLELEGVDMTKLHIPKKA